jgi:hypothetical protein
MNLTEQNIDKNTFTAKKGMENLVTCQKCQFVYDVRYLSESCRFEEDAGYKCMNCNAIL